MKFQTNRSKVLRAITFLTLFCIYSQELSAEENILKNNKSTIEKVSKTESHLAADKTTAIDTDTNSTRQQPLQSTENNQINQQDQNTLNDPVVADDKVQGPSLYQTIKHGGVLMIFLVIMGLFSLAIIAERLIFYTRYNVWKHDHMVTHLKEVSENSHAQYKEKLESELRYIFQVYINKLERGLSLLSGLGNLAPIVGFLGTVIGMIGAFSDIMMAASVNAKVVAGGIKVALVTTAGGLIVAAPTLGFFYFFMHVIHEKHSKAEEVIGDFSESKKSLLNGEEENA
jgi:biopolymer transport protein ExbB/TolQ